MKRIITLVGVLVLALAVLAGPALAQSPLPTEAPQEPLPVEEVQPVQEEQEVQAVQEEQPEQLAVTGLELTTGAILAVGLLGAGGAALYLSRRSSSRA